MSGKSQGILIWMISGNAGWKIGEKRRSKFRQKSGNFEVEDDWKL